MNGDLHEVLIDIIVLSYVEWHGAPGGIAMTGFKSTPFK